LHQEEQEGAGEDSEDRQPSFIIRGFQQRHGYQPRNKQKRCLCTLTAPSEKVKVKANAERQNALS
jgi:hypothetical protein